jgi:hypothetical protein
MIIILTYYLHKHIEEIGIYKQELEDGTVSKRLGEYLEPR